MKNNLEIVSEQEITYLETCPGYPFCLEYLKDSKRNGNKIIIKTNNAVEIITCRNIIYCKSDGQYTWIYLINNDKRITAKNLGDFINDLPKCFFRINHNCILNLHFINTCTVSRNSIIKLTNGIELKTSYRKKNEFIKALKSMNF